VVFATATVTLVAAIQTGIALWIAVRARSLKLSNVDSMEGQSGQNAVIFAWYFNRATEDCSAVQMHTAVQNWPIKPFVSVPRCENGQ
jgi:hypothetical protein